MVIAIHALINPPKIQNTFNLSGAVTEKCMMRTATNGGLFILLRNTYYLLFLICSRKWSGPAESSDRKGLVQPPCTRPLHPNATSALFTQH